MAIVLVSYAAGAPIHAANQRALRDSAHALGLFDRMEMRGPLEPDHPLRRDNPAIFASLSGAGLWLWKPQIILDALLRAAPDDLIVYADSGSRFRRSPAPLLELARRHDAVLIVNDYPNIAFTKRDAFILTDTDVPACHASAQLDAAFMIWRNTPASRDLVRRWLELCQDPRALDDQPSRCGLPELPSFRSHRHDQALLTLLVWREAGRPSIALQPRRLKYRYLEHHRRRVLWLTIALWHATHDGPWELRRAAKRHLQLCRLSRKRRAPPSSTTSCTMRRLPDRRIYTSVDHCLAYLRSLPSTAPLPENPVPVHFFWDGSEFGAKPALCLASFLATQDPRRFRPWLWLGHSNAWNARAALPHLAPLLPHLEIRHADLKDLARETPLEGEPHWEKVSPAGRSDLARLLVLHRHGGMYSDLDALFLRDLGALQTLVGAHEFCFQWSAEPVGTNAFSGHQAGSLLLAGIMRRARGLGAPHARRLLPFADAPRDLLLLPVAAFSPLWLVNDGHDQSVFAPFTRFDEFFSPRPASSPQRATLETFFPGAFTYHWHGRWSAPEAASSWAGQLAADIRARLRRSFPETASLPVFGA